MAKSSLLQQAKAIVPVKRAPKWIDKLTPEMSASVMELADSYLSGELQGDWDVRELYVRLIKPNGLRVAETTFRRWISEYAQTKKSAGASQESTTPRRKARS